MSHFLIAQHWLYLRKAIMDWLTGKLSLLLHLNFLKYNHGGEMWCGWKKFEWGLFDFTKPNYLLKHIKAFHLISDKLEEKIAMVQQRIIWDFE